MLRQTRRNHSPALKAKVALAAFRGEQPLAERAQQFDGHPNQVKQWMPYFRKRILVFSKLWGKSSKEVRTRITPEMEPAAYSMPTLKQP